MFHRCISILSLALLSISITVAPSFAGTYYVASGVAFGTNQAAPGGANGAETNINGSGFNRGSIQYPWRTIQYAAGRAVAGDTMIVRDGLYNENVYIGQNGGTTFVTTQTGTSNAHIKFTAEHRGLAFVRGSTTFDGAFQVKCGPNSDVGWSAITTKIGYIDISGFDLASSGYDGKAVVFQWAHHVSVTDCKIHDSGGAGVATAFADYVTIDGNSVYGNCRTSTYSSSGISLYKVVPFDTGGGTHNYIRRNSCTNNYIAAGATQYGSTALIHHGDGNGIIVDVGYKNTQTLVENNVSYKNGGRGIIIDGSQNVDLLNNTCYQNGTDPETNTKEEIFMQRIYYLAGYDPNSPLNAICKNIKVQDNICWPKDGNQGINIQDTTENVSVTNNWLYSGNGSPLIKSNAFSQPGFPSPTSRVNWTVQANYGTPGGTGEFGTAYKPGGNPQFTNAAGGDFHLQSSTGCKDKSISHPQYDRDYYPRPYNNLWDLGAYEYHP